MDTDLIRELNALLWKAFIVSVPSLIVNLLFAAAVLRDAKAQKLRGTGPVLAGPKLWAFATFLGGVFVAAVYWVMHHSTLRRADKAEDNAQKEWA